MPNYSGVWNTSDQLAAKGTSNWPTPKYYKCVPASLSVNEGSSLTVNITTSKVADTTLAWVIEHITTNNPDFENTSGIISLVNSSASFTVSIVADLTTEGPQTFRIQIRLGNAGGEIVAKSDIITVPDTSQHPTNQVAYTTAGTYTWTAPTGVTSVCVVCVGSGGGGYTRGGGGGGGLGWKNNIDVTPGQTYTVVVGAAGAVGNNGAVSYFKDTSTVAGYGGQYASFGWEPTGGSYVGQGGGSGGVGFTGQTGLNYYYYGAGGAGGYTGNGGAGGAFLRWSTVVGTSGTGGGGDGGYANGIDSSATGVSILGSGGGGTLYGAGGYGASEYGVNSQAGAVGAVRIIWGSGRAFPSTNTSNI